MTVICGVGDSQIRADYEYYTASNTGYAINANK